MSTRTWPIVVSDWEIECCGVPPAVGDRVKWTLWFAPVEGDPVTLPQEAVISLDEGAEIERAESGITLVRDGVLSAEWSFNGPLPKLPARGVLHEGHHHLPNRGTPGTEGVVERVQVVACMYERTGIHLRPVPGEVRLREVTRSPKRFRGPRPDAERFAPHEIGVLVDLAVAG